LTFCTSDHGLFVINNQTSGNNLIDICSTSKISNFEELTFVKLGSSELWEFADAMYIDVDTVIPSAEDAQEWVDQNVNSGDDIHSPTRTDLTNRMRNSRKIFSDRYGKIIIRKV
jgi:DNA replication initiation complex subunit (GINS family)